MRRALFAALVVAGCSAQPSLPADSDVADALPCAFKCPEGAACDVDAIVQMVSALRCEPVGGFFQTGARCSFVVRVEHRMGFVKVRRVTATFARRNHRWCSQTPQFIADLAED